MSIEEQVAGALADLEGLLAEDWEAEAALKEAASLYSLKVEVLRHRAALALGDLDLVRDRYSKLKIADARERRLKQLVEDYVSNFFAEHANSALPFIPINNWIRNEFGAGTRDRDIAFATARVQLAFHQKVIRDLKNNSGDAERDYNAPDQ